MRMLRCLLLALLLAGCTRGSGLPRPPGLLGMPRATVTDGVELVSCESVDSPKTVSAFYAEKVARQPGWKTSKMTEEIIFYENNLKCENFDRFKPRDAKKPAQGVLVMPGKDGGSLTYLVTAEPKP